MKDTLPNLHTEEVIAKLSYLEKRYENACTWDEKVDAVTKWDDVRKYLLPSQYSKYPTMGTFNDIPMIVTYFNEKLLEQLYMEQQ
jgi:hypothetical protein